MPARSAGPPLLPDPPDQGTIVGSIEHCLYLKMDVKSIILQCNLRRHPACRDLSDWRHGHGSIKVDPLTSISAIER